MNCILHSKPCRPCSDTLYCDCISGSTLLDRTIFATLRINSFSPVDQNKYLGKQELHCFIFGSRFLTDIRVCNNGHVQIQRRMGSLQKLGDERVNKLSG